MALTKVAPAGIGSTPGDGYRIGSSFLHSTGVEITNINATGILTAVSLDISGGIDFDGHTELDNVNIAGVVTATTFKGDGSQLTGLTAGQIPNLDGAKITTGTVAAARIDNLAASKITSGTVATARLGSGTANNSTYLRGDQTWAAAGPGTGQQYVNLESLGSASNTGNNTFAGYLSGNALNSADHSTFFGYQAGKASLNAGNNCFFGSNSGLIATGGDNSGFGQGTLETITTATENVAVGRRALNTTTSSQNVAVGAQALRYQTSGQKNTTVGYQAGIKITTANNNTAFGYKTLTGDGESHNVTGHSNVVMGYMSGYGISSGEKNVLIGCESGYDMTTGNWNSGLGFQSLENVGVGTCNTACGYESGYTINNGNNNTCLGFRATTSASDTSNEVTIGNSDVTRFRVPGIGLDLTSAPPTLTNGSNNRVVTATGASGLNGEANLTFDGSTLLQFNGTTDPKIRLQSAESGSKRLDLWIDGGEAIGYIAADQSASQLAFRTTGTERLRITSGGDVCIGRTGTISNAKLAIHCDATEPAIAIQCNHTNTDTDLITAFNSSGNNIVNIVAETDNSPLLKFQLWNGSSCVERFRINSSGHVGINGATAASNRIEIIQDPKGFPADSDLPNATVLIKHGTSGSNRRWIGIGASLTGAWIQSSSPGGTGLAAPFWINKGGGDVTLGNGRVLVASGGKVTINNGTYTATSWLDLRANAANTKEILTVCGQQNSNRGLKLGTMYPSTGSQNDAAVCYNAQDEEGSPKGYHSQHQFQIAGDTAMTIGYQGLHRVGIGISGPGAAVHATAADMVGYFHLNSTGDHTAIVMRHNRGGLSGYSGTMIAFRGNDNTEEGSIVIGTTATAYNTSSDYRLKENIVGLSGGVVRVKQLKPYRFNFKKTSDVTVDGFLAHEVASVIPEAVTGTKDAVHTEDVIEGDEVVRKKGDIKPQQLDYAKLTPLLTAALQEVIVRVESLETENTALKARVAALESS